MYVPTEFTERRSGVLAQCGHYRQLSRDASSLVFVSDQISRSEDLGLLLPKPQRGPQSQNPRSPNTPSISSEDCPHLRLFVSVPVIPPCLTPLLVTVSSLFPGRYEIKSQPLAAYRSGCSHITVDAQRPKGPLGPLLPPRQKPKRLRKTNRGPRRSVTHGPRHECRRSDLWLGLNPIPKPWGLPSSSV